MTKAITAIDLAPLHGTILSIIIGAFSVYAISLYLRMEEITQSVFSEALKINHINVAGSYGLTGAPEYQSNDDDVRKRLLSRLTTLGMGALGGEASERGREILQIISALSHYYPFPQRAGPSDEGGIRITAPKPIKFLTIKDVQKWQSDIEDIRFKISWLMDVHKAKFNESINAFQQARQGNLPKMELPEDVNRYLSPGARRDIEDIMSKAAVVQENFGSLLVDGFIKMLNQANGISSRVGEALVRYQVLKRRVPSKGWFLFTIIFGAIAFVAAVILPMFFNTLPSIVWKGIPVAFYLYSLVILVSQTVRLLWR